MSEINFVYWLQGFLEISGAKTLDEAQTQAIRDHISLVLKKVTPSTHPLNVPMPYPVGTPQGPFTVTY